MKFPCHVSISTFPTFSGVLSGGGFASVMQIQALRPALPLWEAAASMLTSDPSPAQRREKGVWAWWDPSADEASRVPCRSAQGHVEQTQVNDQRHCLCWVCVCVCVHYKSTTNCMINELSCNGRALWGNSNNLSAVLPNASSTCRTFPGVHGDVRCVSFRLIMKCR